MTSTTSTAPHVRGDEEATRRSLPQRGRAVHNRLFLIVSVAVIGWLALSGAAIADSSSSRSLAQAAGTISVGDGHTCKVLSDGTLRCWGEGFGGRLGYGNQNDIGDNETPGSAGPVDIGTGRTVSAVSVGGNHTCALLDNGTVRCWGAGHTGQLGYGNTGTIGDNETPGSVGTVDLGAGRTAKAVTAGADHSCALLDDGTVRCWGGNGSGQLGYGNTTAIGDNETPGTVGPVDLGTGRRAVAISAAGDHTCALLDNGGLRCWGSADSGELGYGNTTAIGDNETPGSVGTVDVGAGRNAIAIAAGNSHTCAILDDGTARCWGEGDNGRLGYGNTNDIGDTETPGSIGTVDLGSGRRAVAIDSGPTHNCARLDDGSTRCWGSGIDGKLGYGSNVAVGDDETPGSVGPVNVGAGRSTVAISVGGTHSCAQLDNGTVRCWGNGGDGRLGYGSTSNIGDNETPGSSGPVNFAYLLGRVAVEVTTGDAHTCARLDNGTVRCWGEGDSGRLGYGNTDDIGDDELPGAVGAVDLGTGRSAVALGAGSTHTCALLDDGTVRCWGAGLDGRLGYGNTDDIGDGETPGSVGPVDLGAGRRAMAISVGGSHTCALLDDGTTRCWGNGANGRLGYGNTDDVGDNEAPGSVGPVDVGAGRHAGALATGFDHTCATLDDGTARCWGEGDSGRLGYGNTDDIGDTETPGSVGPVDLGTGRSAVAVDAGSGHSCALLETGDVRCWGSGTVGELGYANTDDIGDGETPGSVGPVDVGAGRHATSIAVGSDHSCARLDDGSVRCWGEGAGGRLGYGNTDDIGDNEAPGSVGPVDLGSGRAALTIDAGSAHTCARLDNGAVRCWGSGASGRLGYGDIATIGDNEAPGSSGPVDFFDDPAVAGDDSTTVSEDSGAAPIAVLSNDTDPDGGTPPTITSTSDPAQGAVVITGGGSGLTYEPDPNACNLPAGSPDTFTYTISSGTTATVSVTVTCIDDPATAADDAATVTEDAPATEIAVLANDSDPDGGPTSAITVASDPAHGAVVITGGGSGLTYQPDPNACNSGGPPDDFTYTLTGGSTASVAVTVTCVDDPDTTAPETTLTRTPKAKIKSRKSRAKATFSFSSSEGGTTFECRLDVAAFSACQSPLVLKVKKGKHSFEVRAIDAAGNVDQTPAKFSFNVKRKKR